MTGTEKPHETPAPVEASAALGDALSPWSDIVGPCYTVGSFARLLKISDAAVLAAAAELRVLRLRTADGDDLFPTFQVKDGHVQAHMQSVLEALQDGIDDPWTWAQWLNTELHDQPSHMSRLWAGDLPGVITDAKHDAWAWRS